MVQWYKIYPENTGTNKACINTFNVSHTCIKILVQLQRYLLQVLVKYHNYW